MNPTKIAQLRHVLSLVSVLAGIRLAADAAAPGPLSPTVLPGRGLAEHDFVYAGEWDTRKPEAQSLCVVRGGKVAWQITMPMRTAGGGVQEFDDAALLPNGNLVFARMSGAGEITPDKRLVWEYPAPAGTEIHSIQPIGDHLVLIARNGNPPLALIIDTHTGKVVREVPVPTRVTGTHGQYRHIRMTKNSTILVPLLSDNRVVEIDLNGRVLWSVPAKSPWSAVRLANGNTLIAGDWSRYVREVNPSGEPVWEFTQSDVPDIRLFNTQTASRLANGNTVVCSWVAGNPKLEEWPQTVQVLEVTPAKKIVWALRSWTGAEDLGPATHIQLLDVPDAHEKPVYRP